MNKDTQIKLLEQISLINKPVIECAVRYAYRQTTQNSYDLCKAVDRWHNDIAEFNKQFETKEKGDEEQDRQQQSDGER